MIASVSTSTSPSLWINAASTVGSISVPASVPLSSAAFSFANNFWLFKLTSTYSKIMHSIKTYIDNCGSLYAWELSVACYELVAYYFRCVFINIVHGLSSSMINNITLWQYIYLGYYTLQVYKPKSSEGKIASHLFIRICQPFSKCVKNAAVRKNHGTYFHQRSNVFW